MTEAEPEVLPKSIIDWQPTHGVGLHRSGVGLPANETVIAVSVGVLALAALAVGAFFLGRATAGGSLDDLDLRGRVRRWI